MSNTQDRLKRLVQDVIEEGATEQGAIRDVVTDLCHVMEKKGFPVRNILLDGYEVFVEESVEELEAGFTGIS